MHKVKNLSSIRNAARLACKVKGCSIKNVDVTFCGFDGLINDKEVKGAAITNEGKDWFYGFERIRTIEGTYNHIVVFN